MDELVKLVQERTGMPEDSARTAVSTVVDYLKDRLPGPLAGQIDSLVGGQSGTGGMLGGLGNPFGKT